MGLGRDIVGAIVREHIHRPISGDVLLIGRQTVNLSPAEALEMVAAHGIDVSAVQAENLKLNTATINRRRAPSGRDIISDAAFFNLLGVDRIKALDRSDYEGAEIIHDLGAPVPDELKCCADFIVDGSTLDNTFNPALTLKNYCELLRPGGRLCLINTLSNHFDPYTIATPSWFFDYFVMNKFDDCRVYIIVYLPDQEPNAFSINVDCLLEPGKVVRNFVSPFEMSAIVFAEKGAGSTTGVSPTQALYRSEAEWDAYRSSLRRIKSNPRPHLVRSRSAMSFFDVLGGYLFMGSDYEAVEPSDEERRIAGRRSDPAPQPKLNILCVGTGRDGTQSLNHMIQRVFSETGGRQTMHEYCCREIYQAFCDFSETGDGGAADALKRMVADCPYDSIVGNGYAAILPLFAEHYGRGLKVVHLYRDDREACIESLITNCELFPTAYRYYSSSPEAEVKRMAAFHFGEMSRAAWDRLPLREKFAWYYDKTHALVRQHLALFDNHIEIATESLNDEAIRRKIAEFVGGGNAPPPPRTHLNASVIDISSFPRQHQVKMNWLMGRLNMEELAKDDVYALNYFLDKFVAWTGYQITNAPQLGGTAAASAPEISADLERAGRIMNERLREIDALYKLVHDRSGKDTGQ
jgi:hypothetical protein